MLNRVRKAAPFALAFVIVLAGVAFAGDNENVTFSTTSDTEVAGIGAGGTVSLNVTGSGMVGVSQYDMTITVTPADAFDMAATAFTPAPDFIAPGTEVDEGWVKVGAANFSGSIDGDSPLGDFVLTASESFDVATEATITVSMVSVGPSSTDRDEFDADAVGISITVNPPITEPRLSAVGATDLSLDFSAMVGEGGTADGSSGEVTLGVNFMDATGAAMENQEVTWSITNNGAESVFLLGDDLREITANTADVAVTSTTGADGLASITLDCEGDDDSGSTSVTLSASTSALNSVGESLDLSVGFSITWDVPVPAELASFAAEVTGDREVLLRWGVVSQTSNLGWEIFRSTDDSVYERIGDLVPGEGTIDVFTTYDFIDSNPPLSEVVYYYLKQIDLDGSSTRSQVISVFFGSTVIDLDLVPTVTALGQNFPNPFNPETTISFDLAAQAQVTLTVYDATGQTVRTLVNGEYFSAGNYRRVWNGLNRNGEAVGSGVYFYELNAGEFTSMKKMTLVR